MRRLIVILLLLLPCTLWAQEPRLVNYNAADGLPSNAVYAIAQDAEGLLWVGTRNGLASFDGVHFQPGKEYGRVNALAVESGGIDVHLNLVHDIYVRVLRASFVLAAS